MAVVIADIPLTNNLHRSVPSRAAIFVSAISQVGFVIRL
jgi:hypothetical protein